MKRDEYIDWLKGFAIFLVVYAHSWQISNTMFWFIYRFHMPLFFCISGYLFSSKKSFKDFIKTKIKTLILPYFVFFIISYLITNFLIKHVTIEKLLKAFLLNGKYLIYVNNWAIWYLVLFFIAAIIFYFIAKIKNKRVFTVVTIILGILTVPCYLFLKKIIGSEFIPFSMQVLPAAIFFMGIGKIYKENEKVFIELNKKTKIILSFILFGLGLIISRKVDSQIISIDTYRYLISALFIIQFIVLITKDNKNKYIRYIGKNSLVILGVHRVLLKLLQNYKVDDILKKCNIEGDFSAILISIGCIFLICVCHEIFKLIYKNVNKIINKNDKDKKTILNN